MKISKAKLRRIIKEELREGLQANRAFLVKNPDNGDGFVVYTDGTFQVDLLLGDELTSITVGGELDWGDFEKLGEATAAIEKAVGAATQNYRGTQEPLDPSKRVDPEQARQKYKAASTGPWAPEK